MIVLLATDQRTSMPGHLFGAGAWAVALEHHEPLGLEVVPRCALRTCTARTSRLQKWILVIHQMGGF